MVVGPVGSASGLVSRKSELASASQSIEHYQYQLEQAEDETGRLAEKVDEDAATLGRYEQRHRGLIADRAAAEAEQKHVDQRRDAQRVVCEEIESEIQSVSEHNAASKAEAQALDQDIIVGRQEIERLELESLRSKRCCRNPRRHCKVRPAR